MPREESPTRILVVEDDWTSLRYCQLILRDPDNKILTASNAEQGLELFLKEKPDLLITDIMMPGMDGCALIEEIRKRGFKDTYIIIVTALNDLEERDRGLRTGANDFITKPISREDLAAKVKIGKTFAVIRREMGGVMKERGRILETIAFDFIIPLSYIGKIAEVSSRENSSAPLEYILREGKRMLDLDLTLKKNLSNIEIAPVLKKVRTSAFVKKIYGELEVFVDAAWIDFGIEVKEGDSEIMIDEDKMEKALVLLFSGCLASVGERKPAVLFSRRAEEKNLMGIKGEFSIDSLENALDLISSLLVRKLLDTHGVALEFSREEPGISSCTLSFPISFFRNVA